MPPLTARLPTPTHPLTTSTAPTTLTTRQQQQQHQHLHWRGVTGKDHMLSHSELCSFNRQQQRWMVLKVCLRDSFQRMAYIEIMFLLSDLSQSGMLLVA